MKGDHQILAFNRGVLSRLAMARTDLKRYAMSAAEQTNWMPRVLGSAMLRPGWGYLGSTKSDARAKYLDFIFAVDDTALLELTDSVMRVWVDDELVTRPAVTAAITNGAFNTDLSGWTDIDVGAASSAWSSGGYMELTGTPGQAAGRRQAVTINEPDVVHGLRVVVTAGLIELLVGSTAGGEDYFRVSLGPGTHSLAFTPTGNISIDVVSRTLYPTLVDSVSFDGAGVLELPTPWTEDDLPYVRKDQSGDILYVACNGMQQRKIERRGTTSWSVALYQSDNGPLRAINTSDTIIEASSTIQETSLFSSAPLFKAGHVGAIFRLDSDGQIRERVLTDEDQNSEKIIVTGVGNTREFSVILTAVVGPAFVGTITLQRSVGDTEVWEDTASTYTAVGTSTFNDGLDNQTVAYRLRINTGDYTSGSIVAQLRYQYGSITGYVRIKEFIDSTHAVADVLQSLGSYTPALTTGTGGFRDWYEGAWSDYRGWPSSVALHEGRLWWAGKDKWWGSVSDDFSNFDIDYEGDAGPIQRSIGAGPVDVINWLLSLQRLMAGTDGAVVAGRSTSFDEPLTPSNFNPKAAVTQGSERIAAVKIDDTAVFVQRGGHRVLSLAPSIESNSNYGVDDLSQHAPEVLSPGVVALAIQRQPDTRIHCVRSDGSVAIMVFDKTEDVKCWIPVETSGSVEDVVVLPGADGEEAVYYVVNRTIDGDTKRYLERWAREDECTGGATNKLADSFVVYDGSNLDHIEGERAVGWYNGTPYGDDDDNPVLVSGGVAAGFPVGAIVGLYYESRFRSTKLAYITQPGQSGIPSKKRINALALVLADTHASGIKYGRDFTTMDDLPLVEGGAPIDTNGVWEEYSYEAFALPGEWGPDERLCLKAAAPKPCTLLAAIISMSANATT